MTAVPMNGSGEGRLPVSAAVLDRATIVLWTLFLMATSTGFRTYGTAPIAAAWWIADLSALALFLRYQSQFINLALGNLVFMSWPLVACLSALWSIAPMLSFTQGLQLLMTILVAFLACIQLRLERLVMAVFSAMFIVALATLASHVLGIGEGVYERAWRGFFSHKNIMGGSMAILILTALCLFLAGRWRRISLAGAALGFFLLAKSQSAAALMTLAASLVFIPFAYVYFHSRMATLLMSGAAIIAAAVGGAALYGLMIAFGLDPIDAILSAVGKDRTLTGRTLLWDLAADSYEANPMLGVGFKAYWTNVPAEMRDLLMTVGGVFHFHNNYLDAAVAFGFIGPILLALGVLVGLGRTTRDALVGRDMLDVWPLLIAVQTTVLTFVENPLMWNHNIWQFLFVAIAVVRR